MDNWPRGVFEVNEPRIKGKLNFVLTDGEHVYISASKLFELEATDLIVKIGSSSVPLSVDIHLYFKDGGWRFGDVAERSSQVRRANRQLSSHTENLVKETVKAVWASFVTPQVLSVAADADKMNRAEKVKGEIAKLREQLTEKERELARIEAE